MVVLLTTPRKPVIATAGSVSRTRLKIGMPSMTAPSNRKRRPARSAARASAAVRERDRPLVRGDDVRAARERRPHVIDRRLPARDIERRRLHDHEARLARGAARCIRRCGG